jgi:hypothetical protein
MPYRWRQRRIWLALPTLKQEGIEMTNTITLKDTDVYTITIGLVDAATGIVMPFSPGDTFSAASSDPAIGAAIGLDANGNPALVVRALTLPDANTASSMVTVTDSAGDVAAELTVLYPVPPAVGDIVLDVATAAVTAQPAPTAPGP